MAYLIWSEFEGLTYTSVQFFKSARHLSSKFEHRPV